LSLDSGCRLSFSHRGNGRKAMLGLRFRKEKGGGVGLGCYKKIFLVLNFNRKRTGEYEHFKRGWKPCSRSRIDRKAV
jgi:hypothetical protein